MKQVAIVDVGSNSIKYLIAAKDAQGVLVFLKERTAETRISHGIGSFPPVLQPAAIQAAESTLRSFMSDFTAAEITHIVVVATSAVRDAINREEFAAMVKNIFGVTLRILSGDEEARLIAAGVSCDPNVQQFQDFCLFDLGGGSLEVGKFSAGKLVDRLSLPLGAVRLTEQLIPKPHSAIPEENQRLVTEFVQSALLESKAAELLRSSLTLIGLGGAVSVVRVMQQATPDFTPPLLSTPAVIDRNRLDRLTRICCASDLSIRRKIPGLPAARADIIPAALLTMLALCTVAKAFEIIHSPFNLKFGLAIESVG